MGHLVNPLSLRLSINSFWNSNWVIINNYNYINIFKKDYQLFTYLNWFFKKSNFEKMNILLSHYKIYRLYKRTYINLYIYDAESQNFRLRSIGKSLNRYINKVLKKKKKKFFNLYKFNKIATRLYNYIFKSIINLFFWKLLNFINIRFLNLIKNQNLDLFYFNIYSINFYSISVEAITSHISLRLQKKFSLNWILYPILKDLNKKIKYKNFLGYKLVCSGRFTRKQIATYMWYKNGSLNFNSITNLIRYSEVRVRLKFGLCGIKLWISYGFNNTSLRNRNMHLIYPIYIPYRYNISFYKGNKFIIFYLNNWFFFFIKILFLKNKGFNYYKNFIKIRLKVILLNNFVSYKIKSTKFYKKVKLNSNKKSIPAYTKKKILNYKNYIKTKLILYRITYKLKIKVFKIILLKYNKFIILDSNKNAKYFAQIYKKIKHKI